MNRNETGAIAARESPELEFDVRDQVVIARAIVLVEECVDVTSSPALTKTDVGHGQALEYGRVDRQTKDVRGYPIHRPPVHVLVPVCEWGVRMDNGGKRQDKIRVESCPRVEII